MPDMWMDVDTAVQVPVSLMPLVDRTDFITIEDAIVYNEAGMAIVWNFVTTAGVMTTTAFTPTTAGVHDWLEEGTDKGMYSVEIPDTGGTVNNDTEGFGWISGETNTCLPFRGPVVGFRAAALNNSLVDGTTIDVNVTAMAANVLTASAINAAALTAAKFAAGALDANALATDAVNEIARAIGIQKNTALNDIQFLMVQSGDDVTPATGLSPSVERSIDGGAMATGSNTVTELSDGIYTYDASAADMNGDSITFRFFAGTANDVFLTLKTVA